MKRADRHPSENAYRFEAQPLREIYALLTERLKHLDAEQVLRFTVLDPDAHPDLFVGEMVEHDGRPFIHRDHATWMELAEALGCAYQTPIAAARGLIEVTLRKLPTTSWHDDARPSGHPEKYGTDSQYARINRFEQPAFLHDWYRALRFLAITTPSRVLSLGCNQGRELAHIPDLASAVGIDHSASSIASARNAFPEFTFLCEDVANLPDLSLGAPFDLIIAINTLHATGIDMARTLRHLVSERLTTKGGLLLGLPNSRHRSTSLTYGTQAKNRRGAELTPVVKDAMFIRRYMNQHRFDVRILGKHNVLIAGRRGGSKSP